AALRRAGHAAGVLARQAAARPRRGAAAEAVPGGAAARQAARQADRAAGRDRDDRRVDRRGLDAAAEDAAADAPDRVLARIPGLQHAVELFDARARGQGL